MWRLFAFWLLLVAAVLAMLFGLFQFMEAMPVQGMVARFHSQPPSFLARLLDPLRLMFEGQWREPALTEFLLAMATAGLLLGGAFVLRRRLK